MNSETGKGRLILAATPIGNLEDITYRTVRMMAEADIIAAEDTRNSMRLLNHFDIHTPLTSYHEYNKIEKAYELIGKIKEGRTVLLITDAGTPAISDPGEDLVRIAYEEGVEVTSLPGPCACVTALTLSGLPTGRFCFEAFLPAQKKERRRILEELKTETRTIVLYEAPHRLVRTLKELLESLGDRRITLCRELTKIYEEAWRTTIAGALESFGEEGPSGRNPRGEYVLVIEGCSRTELQKEDGKQWDDIDIGMHLQMYLDQGMDRKEAMKAVAGDRNISKRDVYRMLLTK